MIRVEPSVLVFLAFISKTVNNQCYNPYIFGKISKSSFQKCMVVALIVYRFRDKLQKHLHPRLNSYRGDYTIILSTNWVNEIATLESHV